MKKWLRRIRGANGMGLAWALAWFGAGVGQRQGLIVPQGSTLRTLGTLSRLDHTRFT